jgi:preprotein translocase subunit SecB
MKPSSLQLERFAFLGISVEPVVVPEYTKNTDSAIGFDFDGVKFGEKFDVFPPKNEDDRWGLTLTISIPNVEDGGKICPYTIDVSAIGFFYYTRKDDSDLEKRNMVVVNGLAVLYATLRELVAQITARSIHGELLLPTVNFLDKLQRPDDLAQNQLAASQTVSEDNPKKPRKRTTKSTKKPV